MKLLIWLVRVVSGFIGFFILSFSLAEVLGLIPHSDETPTIVQRFFACVPALIFSVVLLVPHSLSNQGHRYSFLLGSYIVVTLIVIYIVAHRVQSSLSGTASWDIILVGALLLLMPISNGLALWYVHKNPKFAT